jgi:Phage tail assembly chaperone
MAKFKLVPDPIFKRKVAIPLPGDGKAGEVEFVFKFRGRDELSAFYKRMADPGQDRIASVMEMAVGWDLEDEFNAENVKVLDETFIGALEKVVEAYWEEHTKAIEKN